MKWIKLKLRPTDDEEKAEFGFEQIWDCHCPDIDDEVLVSDGRDVWLDVWVEYGIDCIGLESTNNESGLYWMPLPEPPKEVEG